MFQDSSKKSGSLYIDNEQFDVKPLRVTLLENTIQVYTPEWSVNWCWLLTNRARHIHLPNVYVSLIWVQVTTCKNYTSLTCSDTWSTIPEIISPYVHLNVKVTWCESLIDHEGVLLGSLGVAYSSCNKATLH